MPGGGLLGLLGSLLGSSGGGGSSEPDDGERKLLRSEDGSWKSWMVSGDRMTGGGEEDPLGIIWHDLCSLSRATSVKSVASPAAAAASQGL